VDSNQYPSQSIRADIHGNVGGQVAVGNNIQQTQTQIAGQLNPEEIQELKQLFEQLKSQVQENAPAATKEAALERIDELEEATMGEQPDPSTMEYVRNWFRKNIPMLAEAVTQVITNPLVGKMIGAAGDLIAAEFKRRFGLP
jgi:hypothetical protein